MRPSGRPSRGGTLHQRGAPGHRHRWPGPASSRSTAARARCRRSRAAAPSGDHAMPLEFVTPRSTSRTVPSGSKPVQRAVSGVPVVGQASRPRTGRAGSQPPSLKRVPAGWPGRRDHVALGLPGVVEQQETRARPQRPSRRVARGATAPTGMPEQVAAARSPVTGSTTCTAPARMSTQTSVCGARRPSRAPRTAPLRRGRARRPRSSRVTTGSPP